MQSTHGSHRSAPFPCSLHINDKITVSSLINNKKCFTSTSFFNLRQYCKVKQQPTLTLQQNIIFKLSFQITQKHKSNILTGFWQSYFAAFYSLVKKQLKLKTKIWSHVGSACPESHHVIIIILWDCQYLIITHNTLHMSAVPQKWMSCYWVTSETTVCIIRAFFFTLFFWVKN